VLIDADRPMNSYLRTVDIQYLDILNTGVNAMLVTKGGLGGLKYKEHVIMVSPQTVYVSLQNTSRSQLRENSKKWWAMMLHHLAC
jgi:hypothetical protein